MRLVTLLVAIGLAGCDGIPKLEPLANSNDGYDNYDSSDDGMYDQ